MYIYPCCCNRRLRINILLSFYFFTVLYTLFLISFGVGFSHVKVWFPYFLPFVFAALLLFYSSWLSVLFFIFAFTGSSVLCGPPQHFKSFLLLSLPAPFKVSVLGHFHSDFFFLLWCWNFEFFSSFFRWFSLNYPSCCEPMLCFIIHCLFFAGMGVSE